MRFIRVGRFVLAVVGLCVLCLYLTAADPAMGPGAHASAGKAVVDQGEKDWVDGRWSKTDVGPFLQCYTKTPSGNVPKGLSIRVGESGEGAVVYDTGEPSMRGAWTGGFLKFDASRFGLIRPPSIVGDWKFSTGGKIGWLGVRAHHEAMHLNGKRVVIDTKAGETLVRETPWLESTNGSQAFTRTIEIESLTAPLSLRLEADLKSKPSMGTRNGIMVASTGKKDSVTFIAVRSDGAATLEVAENTIDLKFSPAKSVRRVKVFYGSGAAADAEGFEKLVRTSAEPENLVELSRPGPARWLPESTTKGQLGFPKDGFAVDTLTVPYANPWDALMFCSGIDFFRDGSAAVCTIHGDVWKVTGINDKLDNLKWKRFATGLFQPLGLRVVNDKVYVTGRDQITVLTDENGDGEADRYVNFYNGIKTSPGHDYVTCLECDASGNFYFVDPTGVHVISPDGRTTETLATGFRNPNGLGVSPDGIVTVTPQQGNWTPSSAIVEVKRGGYYGFGGPRTTPERPEGYDPMLCWLPHSFDNSSSSETWVPQGAWGALGGHLLHFAWGKCEMMLILRDAAAPPVQGAAVGLPVRFLSGPMRGTFRRQDGQLYVACSTGWQTSAVKDGALQRIRYNGAKIRMPVGWRAHRNGIELTFAEPLDKETAGDSGSFALHQWNYRYTKEYGSADYSVIDPQKEGHDEVEVKSARVLADGRTVFLETPELKPVMQMEVKYNIRFVSGGTAAGPLFLTLNRLDAAVGK